MEICLVARGARERRGEEESGAQERSRIIYTPSVIWISQMTCSSSMRGGIRNAVRRNAGHKLVISNALTTDPPHRRNGDPSFGRAGETNRGQPQSFRVEGWGLEVPTPDVTPSAVAATVKLEAKCGSRPTRRQRAPQKSRPVRNRFRFLSAFRPYQRPLIS